jgi:hypothetical protein
MYPFNEDKMGTKLIMHEGVENISEIVVGKEGHLRNLGISGKIILKGKFQRQSFRIHLV